MSRSPQSFHDQLIDEIHDRPLPTDARLPDLLDLLLQSCVVFYGPIHAKERAIAIIRQQQVKGMETYGRPLNSDTPIDWIQYYLEEIADGAGYQRGLPQRIDIKNERLSN